MQQVAAIHPVPCSLKRKRDNPVELRSGTPAPQTDGALATTGDSVGRLGPLIHRPPPQNIYISFEDPGNVSGEEMAFFDVGRVDDVALWLWRVPSKIIEVTRCWPPDPDGSILMVFDSALGRQVKIVL
jgi:hypothetical protein